MHNFVSFSTKIYSGVRTGQLLQVPTLFNLCIRVLQKNIDGKIYKVTTVLKL